MPYLRKQKQEGGEGDEKFISSCSSMDRCNRRNPHYEKNTARRQNIFCVGRNSLHSTYAFCWMV